MKRIITVFFVCLFSVLLMVGATTSSAAEISSSSDYFNYKATYIKDYCTYDYLVNEMRLPYRSFVETLNQDAAFQTELAAWELVNISPDLLVAQITDTKQCKYYEAIIMDLLVRDTQEASFAENMQSMKDLIHVNAWKTFINFNNEISKDTPITSENSMSLLKDMKMAGIFSDILEGADTVIDSAVNIKDLFDKLSKIETIRRMSKSYALVLDQMSNQCNDIYLTAAINNVKMFFSDNLTIDQIKSIVVLESTSSTVYTAFMENVKKMVVKSMGLTGMSVSLAQSAGTAVSNTLFGTGNMVSDYYQMSALYEIEDLLRSSLKITSGGTFCAAFKMYENICLMGCDYSKKYVEPLHTSLFGKLFSWATNQNYENYSKQLDDLKSQISFMFNMIDVGADSWYIIDTGNAQNMSDVNSFYRTSNYAKSEYTEKSESIRTNVYGTYGSNNGDDITLNGNLEIYNDFKITGGKLDLNGYKLTINGNLLQSGGEMYINGGTLEVSGDYRIQSYTKNSSTDEMEYTSSSGYLNMTKTKDLVKVKGSFFTQSSMGGYNTLEAGTMKIGGDFKQIQDNSSGNFAARGTHTVIFNGTKTQHISFDSTSSHFNNLKLIKDKENDYVIKPDNCWKTLYLDTCVNNVVIVSDVTSLKPKESYTMYARVDGINKPSQEVMWTVTGNTDTQTTFSENGVLTIGTNEKADKITVTAVSIEDSTKSASIDIHIEIPVPIVIGVKITPTVVSLANGDTYNFVADVYGLYSPSQNVEWTISGNQSDKTKIDVNGNLTVAKDESSNKIVVMATAVADRTKSTGVEVNIIQVKIIPTVVNVTVTNTTAIMAVGGSQTLKAIVTGSNNPSQDVTWSVSGNNSVDTVISKDGILTIAKNETTSALVVCATSVANPKKYGEFVIEISNSGDLKDLRGDVSGDGKVSIVDAVVAARYILGSVELDESQIDRTDINGDGKITLADVIMIQRIMM